MQNWGDEETLEFAGRYGKKELVYKAQPVIRTGHALMLNPWEYLDSGLTLQDYKSLDKYASLETDIVLIDSDGYIYQGSDFIGIWSVGKIGQDNLENIIRQLASDPLARAIDKSFGKIVSWAIEADPSLSERISPNPDGREVMIEIFKDPYMRLYLTKRLVWEEYQAGLYPDTVINDLGLKAEDIIYSRGDIEVRSGSVEAESKDEKIRVDKGKEGKHGGAGGSAPAGRQDKTRQRPNGNKERHLTALREFKADIPIYSFDLTKGLPVGFGSAESGKKVSAISSWHQILGGSVSLI